MKVLIYTFEEEKTADTQMEVQEQAIGSDAIIHKSMCNS